MQIEIQIVIHQFSLHMQDVPSFIPNNQFKPFM